MIFSDDSGDHSSISVVQHATKRFGRQAGSLTILDDFSLSIRQGDCLVLLGPNACGKSTLLKTLLGLERLDSGLVDLHLTDRDVIGCVLQDYRKQLILEMSLSTNLHLPLGGQRDSDLSVSEVDSQTREVASLLGHNLELNIPAWQLSGGQQQAFVVARACAYQPDFYIWDEPTSAIDVPRRLALYRFIHSRLKRDGSSAIWVTHDWDEALMIADRIIVLNSEMKVLLDTRLVRNKHELDWSFLETETAAEIRRTIRHAVEERQAKS